METSYFYDAFFGLVFYFYTVNNYFELACSAVTLGSALQGWKNTVSAAERF